MKWIDKLERKFGRYAIKNLMAYIISANAIIYFVVFYLGQVQLLELIALVPQKIMEGQIWRLITFIFVPPMTSGIIWLFFTLYFYYLAGSGLESQWGAFKFNTYYLCGMVGVIVASFITGSPMTASFLNMSLFLAFAKLFPDFEVLVFFVLPVPIKVLAWIDWFYIIYNIIFANSNGARVAAIVSLINYFIFFGKDIILSLKNKKTVAQNKSFRKNVAKGGDNVIKLEKGYIHKCTVCGITENDDPDMEFRYCSKCTGNHEYCMNHIRDHEHR